MDYHLLPAPEVAQALRTAPTGLDAATAAQRLAKHGPNQLADTRRKAWWQLLLHQFTDVMILVLLAAAGISVLVNEAQSAYVILAIIALNAALGFGQEYRADKAMAALQQLAPQQAQVRRGGQCLAVPAASLVPGDVVLLEAGNVIPADVRFLETHALKVDESSLTGESANVEKNPAPLPPGPYPLGDRLNLGYKGTFVTNGRATAYVVATGMHTELGKIAGLLQAPETQTPLQQRLGTFGKWLATGAVGICAVFFAAGWWRGEPVARRPWPPTPTRGPCRSTSPTPPARRPPWPAATACFCCARRSSPTTSATLLPAPGGPSLATQTSRMAQPGGQCALCSSAYALAGTGRLAAVRVARTTGLGSAWAANATFWWPFSSLTVNFVNLRASCFTARATVFCSFLVWLSFRPPRLSCRLSAKAERSCFSAFFIDV